MQTMIDEVREKVDRLRKIEINLKGRDFLATWDHDEQTIRFLILATELLEDLVRMNMGTRLFDRGLGMSIFRDKSTRTRYAFKSACNLLGLVSEELDESTSQVAHGETVRETAAMIGFLTEVFGIRDDIYLGEGHLYMSEVAKSLAEAHREGALMGRPSVINLQSDLDHPTQAMADLRHLANHFGGIAGLKGRTIAVSWAYSPSYGKPLSVPQGVIGLLSRFGMHVRLAHPHGYSLAEEPVQKAMDFARESGGSFSITHSMEEAFAGADIVYPKSWAPYAVMEERTSRLRAGWLDAAKELEKDALARNAEFAHWTCDEEKMALTSGGNALYMHCLPADITGVSCERGEVSRGVFEKARVATYREASHKPFVIAAMILALRFGDPARQLSRLLEEGDEKMEEAGTKRPTMPPPSSRRF